MKLVLAGSMKDYEKFIEVLRKKGKDTSMYVFISGSGYLYACVTTSEIVKLGRFKNHPQHEEILAIVDDRLRRELLRRGRRQGQLGCLSEWIVSIPDPIQPSHTPRTYTISGDYND